MPEGLLLIFSRTLSRPLLLQSALIIFIKGQSVTLSRGLRRRRCVCFGIAEWCAIIGVALTVLTTGSRIIAAVKNSEAALKERVTALEVKVDYLTDAKREGGRQ